MEDPLARAVGLAEGSLRGGDRGQVDPPAAALQVHPHEAVAGLADGGQDLPGEVVDRGGRTLDRGEGAAHPGQPRRQRPGGPCREVARRPGLTLELAQAGIELGARRVLAQQPLTQQTHRHLRVAQVAVGLDSGVAEDQSVEDHGRGDRVRTKADASPTTLHYRIRQRR